MDKDARIDPPIQTEYLRSGGATTLIFMVDGAKAVISFVKRSEIPLNIVVPPERTMFAYKSLRISTSHFMMVLNIVSWIPSASFHARSRSSSSNRSGRVRPSPYAGQRVEVRNLRRLVQCGIHHHQSPERHRWYVQTRTGKHGLDVDVHGGYVEGLEHDLGHLLTVGLGVQGCLGQQDDGVLLWGDAQLVVEGVVPDLLHIVP